MKNLLNKIVFVSILLPLFASCVQDEELTAHVSSHGIKFLATISNGPEITTSTRALVIDNLTYEAFPTPIYIRMDVNGLSSSGRYLVKSGYEGRLTGMEDEEELTWTDLESGHNFRGWTMPWHTDENPLSENYERVSFRPEYYKNIRLPEEEYKNCAVLEKFIGTKAGPVNYNDNGEYVELRFNHLVSKVIISSINLITNDGTSWQDVQGEMTIFDIPENGYFYRNPEDGSAPFVKNPLKMDYPLNTLGDVTYDVSKGAAFYICPEVDFKDLKFKIRLTWPSEYGVTGDYYGDFSAVQIRRNTGEEWDEGKSRTVLYANEVIELNLTLSQGNVTGVTAYINNWDNKDAETSKNYPHKGIYTDAQASDLFGLFNNSPVDKGAAEEMFDKYGEEDEGEKVFHVYEDVTLNGSDLLMDEDYVLDGMGHTITMTPDSRGDINISNVRDVYITDGTTTIYIDPDGNIFRVDLDTGVRTSMGRLDSSGPTTIRLR